MATINQGEMKINSLVYKSFALFIFTANTCISAEQKYNPYSRQWETVSPSTELTYNPHSRQWNYAPKDSSPTYNPYERSWDMAPDGHQQKYNLYEKKVGILQTQILNHSTIHMKEAGNIHVKVNACYRPKREAHPITLSENNKG